MSRRVWALATALQSLVVVGVIVLATASGGSAASAPEPAGVASLGPEAVEPVPQISVVSSLSLQEARIIVDAAVAQVRAEGGRAAIAVVDDNGNVVSMDRMDGASGYFGRFAVGKAVAAVALQQPTSVSAEQYRNNPERILSALSILQGEVWFTRGGVPIVVDGRIIGGVGSAGHGPDRDEPAVQTGIAAWERFHQGQ
jgi:glc operon protein GlcG